MAWVQEPHPIAPPSTSSNTPNRSLGAKQAGLKRWRLPTKHPAMLIGLLRLRRTGNTIKLTWLVSLVTSGVQLMVLERTTCSIKHTHHSYKRVHNYCSIRNSAKERSTHSTVNAVPLVQHKVFSQFGTKFVNNLATRSLPMPHYWGSNVTH